MMLMSRLKFRKLPRPWGHWAHFTSQMGMEPVVIQHGGGAPTDEICEKYRSGD